MKRSRTIETVTTVPAKRSSKKSKSMTAFKIPRTVGRTATGFPAQLRMKHRYVQLVTMTSTAGSTSTQNFSCNGMFDPDITGSGSQPLYFDQLAALYNHYTVVGSKISLQAACRSANTHPTVFGVFINDDSTVTNTTWDKLCEQNSSSYSQVMTFNGGARCAKKWSANKNFGSAIGDPNLQGTAAANPTEQSVFTVFHACPSAAVSAMTTDIIITIEYDAVWQELKDIVSS